MLAVGGHLFEDLDARCIRMTTPFGGGIGGSREELCGAFSAGVMVIGGQHGRVSPEVDDALAYELAKAFRVRFMERWGTLICGPIREAVTKPDGSSGCDEVVFEAAHLLLDLLEGAG